MVLGALAPVPMAAWPEAARIASSPGWASLNSHFEMRSSSSEMEPVAPQISSRRCQPGQRAVLASMAPKAPSGNFRAALAVSSASICP